MNLTRRELARREEFGACYRQGEHPAMQAIERGVCGCDYGATSWATRAEADLIVGMLGLRPGLRMLEIGAGSGWPALYMAARTGCDVVLTDLPLDGLRIAARRAIDDRLSGTCLAAVADAACLPFASGTFDALSHSDVLCCLVRKREVLAECRRILRWDGLMAFSVIYIPEGLDAEDHALAVETAPEFVETDMDYPAMLEATDWQILERHDFTATFAQSCRARLRLEQEAREVLLPVAGAAELDRRLTLFSRRLTALGRQLLKRELFLVVPRE